MDVVIGSALMLIIFVGLVGVLRSSLQISSIAKTRSIATTIAESQMEYIRSLSYDAVGTVGGIPAGAIAQVATSTQNNLQFVTRTFIQYEDDPADGTGPNDETGITTDYKRVKVSVSYVVSEQTRIIDLVSNYSPPGLETTTGGGTLRVAVVNAVGTSVPGASVRIQNSALSPTVDVTTFSNTDGVVFLPGAPTSTQYQIAVSKNGYSKAQTYARDATNQNPTPGYLTVVQNQTTTGTFAIDTLAALSFATYYPIATTTWIDTFNDTANITEQQDITLFGDNIVLAGGVGAYAPSGQVTGAGVSPSYLHAWKQASSTVNVPAGTMVRLHVVDASGTLLPDTALSGNASGFTSAVDLSGVSTTTYPRLGLRAVLTTSSPNDTPILQQWGIAYRRGPIPFPDVPFTLKGAKTIGSTGAGAPIYKTTVATTTGAVGANTLSLEWDAYALVFNAYDVIDACNAPPYTLSPGSTSDTSLVLASSTPNRMLVSVRDNNGPVAGASVTLSRSGYTNTAPTTACGSAYFGGVTNASYDISITKSGYTTFNASGIPVSGHIFYAASLEQ